MGQIAHVDQDSSNNSEDNLVFLCLTHHDQYDSKTSQSKNFTKKELLHYRDELYAAIDTAWAERLHFGAERVPNVDPFAGQYIRISDDDLGSAAEILVTAIPGSPEGHFRYAITGDAYWGGLRDFGPNIGQLEFIGTAEDGVIEHISWLPDLPGNHRIRLTFRGVRLTVEEVNWIGVHGMNVTFQGEYQRSA
ncbi:MAG: hypothetical protein ACFCUR_01585 [Rhodomicrobiaceae bacterium]